MSKDGSDRYLHGPEKYRKPVRGHADCQGIAVTALNRGIAHQALSASQLQAIPKSVPGVAVPD